MQSLTAEHRQLSLTSGHCRSSLSQCLRSQLETAPTRCPEARASLSVDCGGAQTRRAERRARGPGPRAACGLWNA
eukprot:228338-Rhodomonas_salina.1